MSEEAMIVVRACADCGAVWYLPRDLCPGCGSETVTARPSEGVGTCAAVTRYAATEDQPRRAFCLIDLDEGARMMARCEPSLNPGDRVTATYVDGMPHFIGSR
ncbi:putative OB-fold protein [Antricoccus suffuscus]|uniref:Putative OB-fold protein n=1 Tax=Antricoccus suffuscus TaxID=1629062 RepID=A0A2T0ZFT9_9ACTN|nr:zinc ribbon domain-containing protein [Antricoccus suffuscus]PRZ35220.1 putative OB-fold protein [Antricoccus suffuscus]